MTKDKSLSRRIINIDVFIGGAPWLELRLCEGLLEFGQHHPQWRFSLRGADFRYTKKWLKKQHIDGVLTLIDSKPVAKVLNASGIPWVHLLPGKVVSQPSVDVDDRAIGRLGAEFFLGKGFLRCAFCGVGTLWSDERAAGFKERLAQEDRKCKFIDIPFEANRDWEIPTESEQCLRRWVSNLEKGQAVMAAHDVLANKLVDLCLRHGLRVPQDIAVLGVGDHDLFCKLSPVPISSIDTGVPEVAIRGATLLEGMLTGIRQPASLLVPPVLLEERRSTEILDYGDDLVARIIAHIRDHACDGIKVGDLVKIFPVSRRTLSRRFIKYVGHSPVTEIRQTRLACARRMLTKTSRSLTEIALTCGYADISHMDHDFRDILGNNPSEMRRKPLF